MARLTSGNRQRWILATMTGAMSMVLIDETVVGVALPMARVPVSRIGVPRFSLPRLAGPSVGSRTAAGTARLSSVLASG